MFLRSKELLFVTQKFYYYRYSENDMGDDEENIL